MTEWKIAAIGSLGRIITGQTPDKDGSDLWDGDEFFVSPKDMERDSLFIRKTRDHISRRMFERFKGLVVPKGSVMYTALSYGFGKIGIASRELIANRQIHSIAVNSLNNSFFVYYLLRYSTPYIFSFNSGIDTPIVPKSVFEKIRLQVPTLPIQRKIAAVLSAYDDLIENNNRRVALLEKMAEELYREWFVRLRFPGHEKVKVVKGIPEGWEVEGFRKLCVLQRGFDLPDARIVAGPFPVIASTSIKAWHNQSKASPPVVTTGRSGSLGTVLLTKNAAWPLNTSLWVKDFCGNSSYFVYYTLKQMKLENFNSGAGVPSLNRNHLNGLSVVIPAKAVQRDFQVAADRFSTQSETLGKRNGLLQTTRDRLLSRLMSGKIDLTDLDIAFPASMREEAAHA